MFSVCYRCRNLLKFHIYLYSITITIMNLQLGNYTLFGHIMRMDDNADANRILLASPPADWRRQLGLPTSRGSAPSNRIWNNTTLRSPKQISLRTALCGGWCRRMVLCNLRNDDDELYHKPRTTVHNGCAHMKTNCVSVPYLPAMGTILQVKGQYHHPQLNNNKVKERT